LKATLWPPDSTSTDAEIVRVEVNPIVQSWANVTVPPAAIAAFSAVKPQDVRVVAVRDPVEADAGTASQPTNAVATTDDNTARAWREMDMAFAPLPRIDQGCPELGQIVPLKAGEQQGQGRGDRRCCDVGP
jgi:hypothetical protein